MCRGIFDIFVGGGELNILILCHLDLPSLAVFDSVIDMSKE